ncbi:radical SAM protein [Geobacter sp. DSM 9736]|uniref:radical SAM protein n=1 Tax=Geobacter sp. DSM 9736 TaxID=1277350 RepID=UPI000B6094EC|nr:radical SAM protein [Geobacter sp. DSM 9736]SNB46137.1 radical SAM methylthiotransferase, MiaB/RimO family [Geobacter sp. DSM 9736]
MNVYIESGGCTRRKLDALKFRSYFEKNGYGFAPGPDQADYILVTTCAFRKEEEEASLKLLDSYRSCRGKVVVYGCLPVVAPSRYMRKFDYDFIAPADFEKVDSHFPKIAHPFAEVADPNLLRHQRQIYASETAGKGGAAALLQGSARYVRNKYLGSPPRYHLITSRGCLGSCSYCALRFAIGPVQSKPVGAIVEDFARGIEAGYRDFSILGDDVGAYGQDRGTGLPDLFAALLAEAQKKRSGTADNARNTLRLHVREIKPSWVIRYRKELEQVLRHRNFSTILCPLQSGSDRILSLMNRGNDSATIGNALTALKAGNPRLKIDTQIMVGFPSETEREFEQTLEQMAGLPLHAVTISRYREREGTPARQIEPKVPEAVITERVKKAGKFLRQHCIRSAVSCTQ